ncbi:hypothetical protein P879_08020 [Paragonimus westermani]|uniref:Uncharacterized protein n=1 Tax=Paragonimus westermani TaxID=34504 RepID=A0A8T0DEJ3_9TREM|nr:hypothetical protein P879_08020 [Paragonimus westermani]
MKCQDKTSGCVTDRLGFHRPFPHSHIALSEDMECHEDFKSTRTQRNLNSWNNCNHPGRHGKQTLMDDTNCRLAQTTEMNTGQAQRDLVCILLRIPRDDFTQSVNASNKYEKSTVTHNFVQDAVQTFPVMNNPVDCVQKITGIKEIQWFTMNEVEQLTMRSFGIRTNEPQPTIQPSCPNHVHSIGQTLEYYVQSTSQNGGAKDCNVVSYGDPHFRIQLVDGNISETTNRCPPNNILSPTITLKPDKLLKVGLPSSQNPVQFCPTDVDVRLLLYVKFSSKSDAINDSSHSTIKKCLLSDAEQLNNKQTDVPSNTDPLLQSEELCEQNLHQDRKHSTESSDSLDYAEKLYASDSPITSIQTVSLTLSIANLPQVIREESGVSFMSGESVTVVDTPPTVSAMAPTVDSLRSLKKFRAHI